MLMAQLHFAHGAIAFGSGIARRARRVELEAVEASGAVVHDGVVRGSFEQERGGLAVQLPIEQDHAVDGIEGNAESAVPFLRRRDGRAEQ